MAIGFIWKKQIVMFVTMFLVVFIGLTIGAFLHDKFAKDLVISKEKNTDVAAPREDDQKNTSPDASDGVMLSPIQTPSLVFPTTKPGGE